MPTQFKIIESLDLITFQEEVNQALQEGWRLHGTMKAYPYTVNDPNDIVYIQAVIFETPDVGEY